MLLHVWLLRPRGPAAALRFLDGLSADPTHEVIDVDRDLRLTAIERWLRRFADLVAGFELVPSPGEQA